MTTHNTSKYRALVFDWDGTLINSAAKIVNCLQMAIEAANLPMLPERQLQNIIGLGLNEAIEALYPDGISEQAKQKLARSYQEHFMHIDQTPALLFDGVRDMLTKFAQSGFYLAIATGKSRRGLDRVLAELELSQQFHITRCADETRSKPHPQMLWEILTDLDLSAENALMIGDTTFDMHMAAQAGMDRVGVTHGVHSREDLMTTDPLILLEHITELVDWLDTNRN